MESLPAALMALCQQYQPGMSSTYPVSYGIHRNVNNGGEHFGWISLDPCPDLTIQNVACVLLALLQYSVHVRI